MPPKLTPLARAGRAIVALGVTLLVLTGCMRVDMNVTINADDTITGHYVIALTEEVMNDLAEFGDSADPFAKLEEPFPGDTVVDEYREEVDGEVYVGKKLSFENISFDDFLGAMNDSDNADGTGGGKFSIERSGGDFVFAVTLDSENTTEYPGLVAEMADDIHFMITVTFPGEVSDTNGELSNGDRTVTWDVDMGGDTELRAVGSASESSSLVLWIIIGVVGILGIAAIVLAAVKISASRKRAAVAAVEVPGSPTPDFPQYGAAQPAGHGAPQPGHDGVPPGPDQANPWAPPPTHPSGPNPPPSA
ncbi:LppM family (lipo)protein [Stackebrandtia soli]|uniref:LppM family (lipo)protein n=1 Tax=Stackebrandtia soli TaxID=1892856 RepID=UPI0039E77B42